MKNYWYQFLLLKLIGQAAICCLPFHLFSQDENLHFYKLSVKEGLSSQTNISDIFLDSHGFVWVGTADGINRFNGLDVVDYRPEEGNPQSVTDGIFQGKFYEDVDSSIWFSTFRALNHFYTKTGGIERRPIEYIDYPIEEDLELIYLDTVGHLAWVLVENQLFSVPTDNSKSIQLLYELDAKTGVIASKNRSTSTFSLIFPIVGGLATKHLHFGQSAQSKIDTVRIGAGITVKAAFFDSPSNYWLGTDKGLMPVDNNRIGKLRAYYGQTQIEDIVSIADIGDGRLVVATSKKGLFLYSKQKQKFIGEIKLNQDGGSISFKHKIREIFNDKNGILWVTTTDSGVFYASFKKRKFDATLNKTPNMQGESLSVNSLDVDSGGAIWALTSTGLSRILPSGSNPITNTISTPTWGSAFHIYVDSKNNVFVCTNTGLYVRKNNSAFFLKVRIQAATQKEGGFTFLNNLQNGKMLASSMFSGMYELQERKGDFILVPYPPFSKEEKGYSLFFEDNEHVYFYQNMTNIVIFKKIGKKLEYANVLKFSASINQTCLDADGTTWLATSSGLFFIKKDNKGIQFLLDSSSPSQVFNSIQADDNCNLWIGSNKGLVKRSYNGQYHTYAVADGLQSMEFNMWSSTNLPDGRLAFGGVNGINIFHPDSIQHNPNPPIVHFTDWVVNDTGSISTNPEYLPHQEFHFNNRTLTFHFIGIDYSDPGAVRYRYYMKDYDRDTVEAGTSRVARYAQLPSGRYTFEVWAANSDGVWTKAPKRLEFTVLPPWYFQWWAILLWSILLICGLYWYYRFRVNLVRKEEEVKRLELEIKQKLAETETAILRLQMNPHFIFNSMNSISSYILQRDIETANDYLSRFARLMRLILELAAKPFIPVYDEVEFLEQYMAAEAMRFENKFKWVIRVDEAIDADDTLVPTMILQPFVENAILHGIALKNDMGEIKICFEKHDDNLCCIVEDNGVGRDAARIAGKAKNHNSKALSITKERLRLIKMKDGSAASFAVIDLVDENSKPSGTRVEVLLPLDL